MPPSGMTATGPAGRCGVYRRRSLDNECNVPRRAASDGQARTAISTATPGIGGPDLEQVPVLSNFEGLRQKLVVSRVGDSRRVVVVELDLERSSLLACLKDAGTVLDVVD